MILAELVLNIFQSLLRSSITVIVDSSLNACKEVFKFMLILLILYYFAKWTFQFLDDISEKLQSPAQLALPGENQNKFKKHLETYRNVGETSVRIGPPDENLIKQRAGILEQLEIEAEFEENLDKFNNSDGDDMVPLKDLFIANIKRGSNQTSRPVQSIKTSLGKKSKLRSTGKSRPSTKTNEADDDQKAEELLLRKFDKNKMKADENTSSRSAEAISS